MTPEFAVIVAGGRGTRMQSTVPKQFMLLQGQPVLLHTLQVFHEYNPDITLVVVLPAKEIATWQALCQQYRCMIPHQTVVGGTSRFHSVQHGLAKIRKKESLVAVHDGVRPLVPKWVIETSFRAAAQYGSGIASVPLKDALRHVQGEQSTACDRQEYQLMQTPQTFRTQLLQKAYQQVKGRAFLDDASVVEAAGHAVHLTEGDYRNIKITTPEDLVVAEALLKVH